MPSKHKPILWPLKEHLIKFICTRWTPHTVLCYRRFSQLRFIPNKSLKHQHHKYYTCRDGLNRIISIPHTNITFTPIDGNSCGRLVFVVLASGEDWCCIVTHLFPLQERQLTQTHWVIGTQKLCCHDVGKILYLSVHTALSLPHQPLLCRLLFLPHSLHISCVTAFLSSHSPCLHQDSFNLSLWLCQPLSLFSNFCQACFVPMLWTHIIHGWMTPKSKGLFLPQVNRFPLLLSQLPRVPQSQTLSDAGFPTSLLYSQTLMNS